MQSENDFLSDQSLQGQFKHADEGFRDYLQIAIYSNLEVSELIIPSNPLTDNDNNPVILYLDNQSLDNNIFEKLYFSLIRKLNDISENQKYYIVVVDRKGTLQSFINVINLLRMIPKRYLVALRILVLSQKSINTQQFTKQPFEKYIYKITTILNNLQKLPTIGMESVLKALNKQGIQSLDVKTIKTRVSTYRKNYVDQMKQNFIDVDEILQTKRHPTLTSYQLKDGVPRVLIQLTECLKSKLNIPGLFRISPNIQQQKQSLQYLDQENIQKLSEIENPHLVTSLIKKIFSRLQPPLFSYELYQFITLQQFQGESGLYLILSMLKKLPEVNYNSLKFLISFIKNNVLLHTEENKMKSGTLAVILAPMFLRSYNASQDDLKYMNKMVGIIRTIIDNCEFLFPQINQKKEVQKHQNTNNQDQQTKSIVDQNLKTNKQEQCLTPQKQPQAIDPNSQKSQVDNLLIDRSVTVTLSESDYGRISNSPGKSSTGEVIQSGFETSSFRNAPLNKKGSTKAAFYTKVSPEQVLNNLFISSCEALPLDAKEQGQQTKKQQQCLSDFQKIEDDI